MTAKALKNEDSTTYIELELILGRGRSYALLYDDLIDQQSATELANALQSTASVYIFKIPAVTSDNWQSLSNELLTKFEENKIRQVSMITFGAAGAIAQTIALTEVKLVRSLIMLAATCRPHPNWRDRLIDRLESLLPLGLPFRSSTKGFDSKPFLQRIRCPVLLLANSSNHFLWQQGHLLAESLPTAWLVDLADNNQQSNLAELIVNFQDVPVKCPQKRRAE